jgi:predicted nucleotidyltransferase
MHSVPSSLDPAVVRGIDGRLAAAESEHGVSIPWAIESGSRAWGFPSPDSDYDCRFVFVRPMDEYLRLRPPRDVIETPPDAVFDVNGWDLRKALGLLVTGNATISEWLRSPIVYSGDPVFRDGMLGLADRVGDRGQLISHYLRAGRRYATKSGPKLKRFFYALRPAAALGWLREHPDAATPPMDLPTLLAESSPPAGVAGAAADLIAAKAVTRELGVSEIPDVLRRFVLDEFEHASAVVAGNTPAPRDEAYRLADEYFLELVRR